MSTRLALQKLRRHLNGLEDYPMSSSYPQDSGEMEFRKMAKDIRTKIDSNQVETTVEIKETKSKYESILKRFQNLVLGDVDQNDIDQVDGRTEDILKPIVKLYFLKILLLDIGISFGDLVTDIAQGMNLIFDDNWNIHWSTFHYGCVVLAIIWLPVIPMLLHILTSKGLVKHFGSEKNKSVKKCLKWL